MFKVSYEYTLDLAAAMSIIMSVTTIILLILSISQGC